LFGSRIDGFLAIESSPRRCGLGQNDECAPEHLTCLIRHRLLLYLVQAFGPFVVALVLEIRPDRWLGAGSVGRIGAKPS
jgi:hypothetical protein